MISAAANSSRIAGCNLFSRFLSGCPFQAFFKAVVHFTMDTQFVAPAVRTGPRVNIIFTACSI